MDIKESILNYISCRNSFEALVKEFVQDKSRPLEERWDIFVKAEVGEEQNYYEDFDAIQKGLRREVSWYDDFNVDRYQTVDSAQLVEWVRRKSWATPELIEELKEEILEKFLLNFEFDW